MQQNEFSPTKGDLDGNWVKLEGLMREVLPTARLHGYQILVDMYEEDNIIPDKNAVFLGFKRAPAAKANHHDFEGGLVYHLLEMWEIWLDIRHFCLAIPWVSNQRILEHIINHDLHKAWRTFMLWNPPGSWKERIDYGKDLSDEFMTNDFKSLFMLGQAYIVLDVQQMNALMWSEGGFSKNRPREASVLAKVGYILDELSGNVVGRLDKRTFLDRRVEEPLP